jgi:hypothetical protein
MDEEESFGFWGSPTYADNHDGLFGESFWSFDRSSNDQSQKQAAVTQFPVSAESPRIRQRTKKGTGPESKANAPDRHDSYDFQNCSRAYMRLRVLGCELLTLSDIVHLCAMIESLCQARGKRMTQRNRAARRRKPNAFHWLDENWDVIAPYMYDPAVFAILGVSACPRTT